jgi:hypothetical protein
MLQDEKLDLILAKLNAIGKAVALREGEMGLVGDGEQHAAAPTKLQIGANPGQWDGTKFDPIPRDKRIANLVTITNFESLNKAGDFVGGTLADWYKKDPAALVRYLRAEYDGVFEMANLSPAQRQFLTS